MRSLSIHIACDGPMCDHSLEYSEKALPEPLLDENWYTLKRQGLKDAHFCCLNCIWQWSKEIVNDPSGGMGPYYEKYKKVSEP